MPSAAHSCPWCDAQVQDLEALCANCMRSPAQHPSRFGAGAGLELELATPAPGARPKPAALVGPSASAAVAKKSAPTPAASALELELPLPATPQSAAAPAAPPVAVVAPVSAGALDDDWDSADLDIGLDMAADVAPPPRINKPREGVGVAAHKPPSSRAPHGHDVPADEVSARADYGPAPSNPFASAGYALRVFRRKRVLAQELAEQRLIHRSVGEALAEKLCVLVDELAALPAMDLDGLMTAAHAASGAVAERSAGLAALDRQAAGKLSQVEQQLARLRAERVQQETDRQLAQLHLEQCTQKQRRLKAALAELDEELEQAHEEARKAAGRNAEFAPPQQARRIAAIEQRLASLREQVPARQQAVSAAGAQLREKQKQLRATDSAMAAQRQARSDTLEEGSEALAGPQRELQQARQRRYEAYDGALARIALERPKLIDAEREARIVKIQQGRADNERRLAVLERAVGAYNQTSYKRGVTLIAAAVVLATLLLLSMLRVS